MDEGDDDLILPNEVVTEYLARAKSGFAHLGKTWEYHIDNGRAIFKFKKQLEAMIRPNNPDQRAEDTQRWRNSMGEFLRVNHLHEDDPEAIWTKAERTNLMKIMERFEEVEGFRRYYSETYGSKKLRRLNNPSAVLDKFLTWKGEKKKGAGKPTKQDETVRLVNILDFCCDHLHVGNGGEYTELKERVERFDGTNFVGVSTEDQQIEAGKWHAENERLSGDLEKATQAVMNTTGELKRVKGQREKQAETLARALDLLKALTTRPADDLIEVAQETEAFLKEMFPENPASAWRPLWDQHAQHPADATQVTPPQQKSRSDRLDHVEPVLQDAVERAATISPTVGDETDEARVEEETAANDIEIPEVYLLPESDEAKICRTFWIAKEGDTYCVYVRQGGECHRKSAASGPIALSMAKALHVVAARDRKAAFDAMTGTEMIEVTRSGKWHPARPSTPTETDEAVVEEETEFEEVEVIIQPDHREQTDEELIRDWLRKTTRRDAETPTRIHNWLRMKHGRDVLVTKVKRLIQKIEPKKPGRPKKQHAAPQPADNVVAPNPREVRMGEIRAVGAYEGGMYPTNEPAPGPCTWFYAGIFKATNSNPTGEWGVIGDGYATQEEAEREVERLLAYEAR